MELTIDAVSILSPTELRVLRKVHAGWTLRRLSAESKISVPQLSRYECAVNGLRCDQVALCQKLLLRAAAEKSQIIRTLIGKRGEGAAESMEAAS